jgi:2-polyprenyl-3-methyl-5-hydroxy-6-metoxy-1,4-benzoquinol methylase
MSEIACNLCGGHEVRELSRRSRSGQPLRTVACIACGLVWSDPRPHDARRFYEDEYRLAYKHTFEPKPKHVLRAGKVALARLRAIEPYLRPASRVLDVGSGGGEFAYLLQSRGHDVLGVEPNRGYADYAAREYGLHIERGFIDDVALPAANFDLITIWHVLEHTEHPAAVLARLRSALKPGGVLIVEVPNVEATCQAPRSTFHEAHLYNFNRATLARMAERAGLEPLALSLSADGGNIFAAFGPQASPASVAARAPSVDGELPGDCELPGNCERIAAIVRDHARRPHWLSAHPYRRAALRLGRMLAERVALFGAPRGRALLDRLYGADGRDARAGKPFSPWPALAVLYLLALAFEEVLVDTLLPALGWTEPQALAPYFTVQSAALVGLLWWLLSRRSVAVRQAALLALAALPAYALPVYC